MRGTIAIIVTLVIAAIVGVGAYQLGLAQGLAATGTPVGPGPYYGGPWFFGGFGFLFPLLFILLFFFLIGGAFRGWGRGYGGPGHGPYWRDRDRLEELHREMHGEKPRETGASPAPPTGR